jgi:hypothetical protein
MFPSRFKRWREVLHAEIGDPSKRNGMEQDIFAWLKFLKANARRASVNPYWVISILSKNRAKTRFGARIPAEVIRSVRNKSVPFLPHPAFLNPTSPLAPLR